MLNVLMSVAQWEREAIGERTATALQHKRANGEYTGGQVPYGWTVAQDRTTLEPAPSEQATIKAARRLRAQGHSLRTVGAMLAEDGHYPRRGTRWYASSVRGLLEARLAE